MQAAPLSAEQPRVCPTEAVSLPCLHCLGDFFSSSSSVSQSLCVIVTLCLLLFVFSSSRQYDETDARSPEGTETHLICIHCGMFVIHVFSFFPSPRSTVFTCVRDWVRKTASNPPHCHFTRMPVYPVVFLRCCALMLSSPAVDLGLFWNTVGVQYGFFFPRLAIGHIFIYFMGILIFWVVSVRIMHYYICIFVICAFQIP